MSAHDQTIKRTNYMTIRPMAIVRTLVALIAAASLTAFVAGCTSTKNASPTVVPTVQPDARAKPDKNTFVIDLVQTEGGRAVSPLPYTLYADDVLIQRGMTNEYGQIVIKDHKESTKQYKVVLYNGQTFTVKLVDKVTNQ